MQPTVYETNALPCIQHHTTQALSNLNSRQQDITPRIRSPNMQPMFPLIMIRHCAPQRRKLRQRHRMARDLKHQLLTRLEQYPRLPQPDLQRHDLFYPLNEPKVWNNVE